MVLSILVVIIRRLISRIQLDTLASDRRPSSTIASLHIDSTMPGAVMDDDRGMVLQQPPQLVVVPAEVGVTAAVAERERGERANERGFMTAARMVTTSTQSTVSTRTACSKRKLEELEIGIAESPASFNSQVRARRETQPPRDEVLESSIAESSGRERGGFCASREAQALDGESEMREEGGNEAVDADAMWEDEPGWNKSGDALKVLTEEKVEDITVGGTDGMMVTSESGSRLGSSMLVSSLVDSLLDSPTVGVVATGLSGGAGIVTLSSGGLILPATTLNGGVVSGGEAMVITHIGSTVRGGGGGIVDEESHAAAIASAGGKDGELSKETEHEGLRSRERESRDSVFVHEEELNRRYSNNHTAVVGPCLDVVRSSGPVGAQGSGGSGGLSTSGYVPSFVAGINASAGNGDLSSLSRPMVVDSAVNPCRLQFFVRTYIAGRTVVIQASASDSVESVHQQILRKTGLPVSEQRLIFGGRQLQHDQTLESCNVVNDATLNLVARMRSTALPHSWQLINDLVATIRRMCAVDESQAKEVVAPKLLHSQDCVRASVQEFLKMASKSVPVSEHMQVFQLAGATSALVMLLLSKVESNRECAEESITQFLNANEEYLPALVHCHCASVLLDFCKLLSKSAPNHSIYALCRNSLARLLDTVGVAHGSPYFHEAKADTVVHDFSPFVNELSLRLSDNLQFIAKAYTADDTTINFATYIKDAKDFTAFVIPLCKAMEVCKGIDLPGSTTNGRCDDGPSLRYSKNDVILLSLGPASVPPSDSNNGPPLDNQDAGEAGSTANSTRVIGVEVGTHTWLCTLFSELLEEVDNCMRVVGEVEKSSSEGQGQIGVVTDDRERPLGWAPFLVVLKGLHFIAKLYDGAMAELLKVFGRRSLALNMLIRQSRWQDDDFWLLEYKSLLDFESKRKLVLAMLPEPQDDHDERQEIIVHRSQLLTESFELLAYVEPDGLQRGISVEFSTEEATGPGVLREWFSMICREIFNCQNGLFLPCPNDRRRFFPNPASGVNPGHLTYFRFCGRVIALALMHKVQVDAVFAITFFKQLAGLPICWEDAKDADPILYESCKKILEMDPATIDSDVLGLTFVCEVEELGTRKILELCQDGKDMVVNSQNRRQFVELLVHRRLVASVADQIKYFSQGFSDLLVNATHQQFLRALEPEDLDLFLYGKDRNICLDDWKLHTEYHDYTTTDDQIIWFWQIVEAMSPKQRRRLLFFSTSVTHLPAEGFAGLSAKFHIHKACTDTTWLPTAHTCFYQLVIPQYPTYEMMCQKLHAITEVHIAEGFGFA